MKRIGSKSELNRQSVIPSEVLDWLGVIACKIAMLTPLLLVLDVFDISRLRRYLFDPTHVLSYEGLELDQDLTYEEKLVQIMDKEDKVLRSETIPLVKVLWRNNKSEEATWGLESDMRKKHPELFV